MAFVSGAFILFVAAVVLFYFLVKKEYRWAVLLVASYVFYAINSTYLVVVLLGMTLCTYHVAKVLDKKNKEHAAYLAENKKTMTAEEKKSYKQKAKKESRRILTVGILFDLFVLLFFKYTNFLSSNVNGIFAMLGVEVEIPMLTLLLPIGISFYTLQAIAYMVDVYWGKCEADKNVFKFMLFMSYFPQIVQGPIARHNDLTETLYEGHDFDYKRFTFGIQLALWGFMKKLVIADRIAIPVNTIFNNPENYSGLIVLFAVMAYGVQIYTDFSGGMDIARGVSEIFGVRLALNFEQPYCAKSIEEFWRRWHATLGGWMRDYIFYPLSLSKSFGNLGKKARKAFGNNIGKKIPSFLAMFVVYFLVGIWHGADWKYVVYGLWNGCFVMSGILLEDVYKTAREKLHIDGESASWKIFQMIRTYMICSFGRFFPRAASLGIAFSMMGSVFKNFFNVAFLVDGTLIRLGLSNANWILLVIMIVVLLLVDAAHERGVHIREAIASQGIVFRWLIYYAALFAVIIFGIYGPAYDSTAFIYQQF